VLSVLSLILTAAGGVPLVMYLASSGERQARTDDGKNLQELGRGLMSFAENNQARMPQAAAFRTRDGRPGLSWRVAILPYIGEGGDPAVERGGGVVRAVPAGGGVGQRAQPPARRPDARGVPDARGARRRLGEDVLPGPRRQGADVRGARRAEGPARRGDAGAG